MGGSQQGSGRARHGSADAEESNVERPRTSAAVKVVAALLSMAGGHGGAAGPDPVQGQGQTDPNQEGSPDNAISSEGFTSFFTTTHNESNSRSSSSYDKKPPLPPTPSDIEAQVADLDLSAAQGQCLDCPEYAGASSKPPEFAGGNEERRGALDWRRPQHPAHHDHYHPRPPAGAVAGHDGGHNSDSDASSMIVLARMKRKHRNLSLGGDHVPMRVQIERMVPVVLEGDQDGGPGGEPCSREPRGGGRLVGGGVGRSDYPARSSLADNFVAAAAQRDAADAATAALVAEAKEEEEGGASSSFVTGSGDGGCKRAPLPAVLAAAAAADSLGGLQEVAREAAVGGESGRQEPRWGGGSGHGPTGGPRSTGGERP